MKSHRQTTTWNAVFTYAAILMTMVSGFVLPPLYLKHISAEVYGAWLASGNLLAWLSALDPGVSAALQQRIGHAYGEQAREKVGRWIGAGVLVSVVLCLTIIVVGLSVESVLLGLLDLPEDLEIGPLYSAFTMAVIATALTMASFSYGSMAYGLQGTFAVGFVQVAGTGASIGVTIFFVLSGDGVVAIAKGMIFRAVFWFLGCSIYLSWRAHREAIKISFSRKELRELVRLTGFTSLGRLGGTLINHMDSFAVTRYLGAETTVALEMTRRAPAGARPIIQRLSNAVMPSISNLDGQGEHEKLARILSRMLAIMGWATGLFVAGFACLNQDFVRLWVGPEYFAGHSINILVLAALSLSMFVAIFSNLCMALGNIEGNSVIRFIESLVFAAALYIGVKNFGLMGAVVAPIIAKLLVGAWYYPRAFAALVDLEPGVLLRLGKEVFKAFIVASILSLLFYQWPSGGWFSFALAGFSLAVTYILTLAAVSGQFRAELKTVNRYIKKRFTRSKSS